MPCDKSVNVGTTGGLGLNSLRGKRFYKGHRDIVEKASHHFKIPQFQIKMHLKNLDILEKALISLKKS
jgi:hypothetical protein